MATVVLERARPSTASRRAFPAQLSALVLLGLLLAVLGPVGYVGGNADDGRYLEAVRCIVAQGYCPPTNHWAARLPLVLPASAALWLFGENRAALMLVPLLYGIASLILFALLVRRVAGERAALIAPLALLGTPIFVMRWPRLNVDVPELFFLLAALSLLLAAIRKNGTGGAILAGATVGLAVLSRTTAIAMVPIIVAGLALFTPKPLKWTLLLGLGGAAILISEAALHALTAGRPLLSWELAHAHTRIPSTALPASVDASRSPILNVDYIANWQRPASVEVHWLLDGALNLLAQPSISLVLLASSLLSLIARGGASRNVLGPKVGRFLACAAAAHFGLLTFVLAVHPTARMFIPIACVGALAIGVWAERRQARSDRVFILLILATMLTVTAVSGIRSVQLPAYESEADRWVRDGGDLTISRTAASVFALSPLLSALPQTAAGDPRPVLAIGPGCNVARPRLLRSFVHEPDWPLPYAFARQIGVAPARLVLCLVSPANRAAAPRP